MYSNVDSRFAQTPVNIGISRSRWETTCSLKTSWNCGELIPIFDMLVLPGDTVQIKTSDVVRLQTLITPLMDSLFLDMYWFFIPHRLVWEHFVNMMGENTASPWAPQVSYTVPQVTAPSGGWNVGTLADYFKIPTGVADISVGALHFRSYAKVVEDWFRSEVVQTPVNIPVSDSTVAGSNGTNYVTDLIKGGKPFIANKFFDLYTACLPAPQKGPDVTLGIGTEAPVYGNGSGIRFSNYSSGNGFYMTNLAGANGSYQNNYRDSLIGNTVFDSTNTPNGTIGVVPKSVVESLQASDPNLKFTSGLYADLSAATAITINELRLSFQLQKWFERAAISGSRYTETIKAHFNVDSPDARLQRSEFLGATRVPININQVVQNSSTDATSPQGNVAGYSLTADSSGNFIKSFTEHGMILGLAVVRYPHSYQQGIPKDLTLKTMTDWYWPEFSHIGNVAVLNKEIYAQGSSVVDTDGNIIDDQVFGYQEAWYNWRYRPSAVTGELRSTYATSLDVWHLGDDYSSLPYLSATWMQEDKSNLDRCLAVQSSVSNQIFGDFYFQLSLTRPMPLYSTPGLVDHF